ncbi:ABC transporter substrate-binding protein [Amycolatopsis rhabdoformis]|uniref:ABC transporter substrate-binding protein n=1 Tax=Amycolatopsis rhabdoformis TaxID=1448059 RepID=A0ABZ1HYD9_9PSEU|nr:ABC transporter substrate-binding protein [Amycolatopsis rhabdoformis]WSE26531.1 ABC transporter substrate-binding protein [Amycolatopsis rhabdoformis]
MTIRRPASAAVALAAVVALTAGACASGGDSAESTPGITADSVTIGSTIPLTGTAAPGYSEQGPAAKAFFDYVNANGGINGRKITLKYLDDAYNPAQTVTLTKQLVLQDKVFAIVGSLGTPTHTKVVDFLNSSRVPDLFVASGCTCWDQPKKNPYTFGWQPDYTVEGKILGDYVKKNFAGKKVAYFYQDDDFGRDGMKGLDKYIDQSSVVTRQPYQPGNTDVAAQVSAIAATKADVVVLEAIPAYTALFKLTSLKLGYSPTLVASSVGADPITVSGLLENFAKQAGSSVKGQDLIEGLVTSAYLPPVDDLSNTWTALFKKIHDQYIPNVPFDGNVYYAMSYAYTFTQALARAGKNPTRQGIVDALQKGGLTGPGLVPFRYSADSHAGYTGGQIAMIKDGKQVSSGTPLTTDDGDGPVTPYTQPQPPAPANGIPAA